MDGETDSSIPPEEDFSRLKVFLWSLLVGLMPSTLLMKGWASLGRDNSDLQLGLAFDLIVWLFLWLAWTGFIHCLSCVTIIRLRRKREVKQL